MSVLPFRRRASEDRQPPELSDEALIAACKVGDRGALAALFERHQRALHRFCSRLLGPSGEVEDLVQSTFLAAWTDAGRYRGQSSVRAWLYGIASNLARHGFRSEKRKRGAFESLRWKPAAPVAPVDEQASRRQLLDRLGAALEELPHDLRVVFVMCEIEEVPGAEAAEALAIRPGTLWRRLHDARKRLLPLLEGGER